MKLFRFILLLLSIIACHVLSAQDNCYETIRKSGIEQYNKGNYQDAAKDFNAAKHCGDVPANNDLDLWLEKCVVTVKLSTTRLEFGPSSKEEQCVDVITKAKTIKVSTTPDWCTINPQGKSLFVSCDINLNVEPRDTLITVTAEGKSAVFEIHQAAADPKVRFKPESVAFSSQNEVKKVKVFSNVTDWTIESTPLWLVAERKRDTLKLVCQSNTSSQIRMADVVVMALGDPFPLKVTQMPGDTVLQVKVKELVMAANDTTEGILVTCNMVQWEASSSCNWLEVARQGDRLMVHAVANQSLFSRHGSISVSCGSHRSEVEVHQMPYVSRFEMPESELKCISATGKDSVMVISVPSDLVAYVDDSIAMTTPFQLYTDFEHHSVLLGFERREYLFNENQQDIVFKPGLRFANITFTAPKNIGLRTGFVSANSFGAFSHFQVSLPKVKEFVSDTLNPAGYHIMVGPVYSPIKYVGIYAGIGMGIHEGATMNGLPNVDFDYEAGVMGFYKNVMVSLGFRNTKWGLNANDHRTTFVFGVGGYLKRYYDEQYGYCVSDSRRWWSLNYMTRPAVHGKGLMVGDLGKGNVRTYLKAMYSQPTDSVRNVDASFGLVCTPVDGLIDFCLGTGASLNLGNTDTSYPTWDLETGVVLNLGRIPLTVMLHESDILHDKRHLFVDFGVGFHLGEFNKSSYK